MFIRSCDSSSTDAVTPPQIFHRRLEMRRGLSVALMAVLTSMVLAVTFAPFDCWYLAYVALVPWVFALDGAMQRRWAYLWGWLAGLIFWAASLYWMWWITLVGYAATVLYLSLYWLAAAIVVRAALRRNWPAWIVLPVVWVSLEYARVHVISGFPWFLLAHSQYAQTHLIQIADVTGQYGVSFFVAMVNGVIVDMLLSPLFRRGRIAGRLNRQIIVAPCVAVLATAGLFGYGWWRLGQQTRSPGPAIAIVQQAFPNDLRATESASQEKIFQSHFAASAQFADAGCDLLVWPETILPKGMNSELLELDVNELPPADLRTLAGLFYGHGVVERLSLDKLRLELNLLTHAASLLPDGPEIENLEGYSLRIASLSQRLGCPVLAGGATVHRNFQPQFARDRWEVRNSALWFDGSETNSAIYSKMHLVPFGEYVPFKHSWLGLHRALRWFVPPVMDQLAPGEAFAQFVLRRGPKTWRLATPICYEGVFARVCRKMVMRDGKKSENLILVNLSNDGWFVWHWWTGRYHGSTEHPQHLVQYCFRAVENRVPVVRAVNTGISASIDSNGRIVETLERITPSGRARTMIPGTMLLDRDQGDRAAGRYPSLRGRRVLVDSRTSLYSIWGDVFAAVVAAAGVFIAILLLVKKRQDTKRCRNR